jgi:hypothetical protein
VHEGDEPHVLAYLGHAHVLSREDVAEIDFPRVETDPAALRDRDRFVMEGDDRSFINIFFTACWPSTSAMRSGMRCGTPWTRGHSGSTRDPIHRDDVHPSVKLAARAEADARRARSMMFLALVVPALTPAFGGSGER